MNPEDDEDPPALEPSSVPPMPIEQFREQPQAISTIPAPDPVVAALEPKLDLILGALGEIKKTVGHLSEEMVELRQWRITTDGVLGAIDRGVSAALDAVTTLDGTVHQLKDVQRDTADKVLEHSQKLEVLDRKVTDRHEHAMARIVAIEDWKKEHTGEDDGSLVSAAAALRSGE